MKIEKKYLFKEVESLIAEGKSVALCVTGESMQPYLHGNGDEIIYVSPFSSNELKPGKIICFRHHGSYIFHRIICRIEEKLIMQGDGVCGNQEEASPSDVIGIVNTVIRSNGKTVSTNSFPAQVYWRCWYLLRPFRRYLLAIYKRIRLCKLKKDSVSKT